MPPKILGALLCAALLQASTPARAGAGGLGIGAEAGTAPALSVQYVTSTRTAYHVTALYGDEHAGLSGDYQRLFVPPGGRGSGWSLATYAGLGLAGEGDRSADSESYRLRLPLGLQCDVDDLRLSAFAEVAGLVGPLPTTKIAGSVAGGLRARF